MDENRQEKVKAGREKLIAYQKKKLPHSKQNKQSSSENSQNSQSENFSFSISVTPPLLPENTSDQQHVLENSDKSISENIDVEELLSSDNENDRSLHEIEVLPVQEEEEKDSKQIQNESNEINSEKLNEKLPDETSHSPENEIEPEPDQLNASLENSCSDNTKTVKDDLSEDNIDNTNLSVSDISLHSYSENDENQDQVEKRKKVQELFHEILKNDLLDDIQIGEFGSATLEQSLSKIKDLQELLSSKDAMIATLTAELDSLRAQFENLSTLSSNTTSTEYKALAEEYLFKRDVENIRKELELAKQNEIEKLKNNYEDRVEDIMKNNDVVLKSLEEKYVEQIDSLKNEVQSLKAGNNLNQRSASQSTSEEELAEVVLSYERRLHEQVELAKHDLIAALELQIQNLLDNNGEDSQWPDQFLQLREIFTKKFQKEIETLKEEHANEIAKLKEEHERFIIRSAERQNRRSKADLELESEKTIIGERDNLKKMNNLLLQVINELVDYFVKCEDELNKTVIEELLKEANVEELIKENEYLNESQDENNISICESLNNSNIIKTKKVHFAPDVLNLINCLDTEMLSSSDNTNELPSDFHKELQFCLKRLKNEASEILNLSANYKKNKSFISTTDEPVKSIIIESGTTEAKVCDNNKKLDSLTRALTNEMETKKKLIEELNEAKKLASNLQMERANLEQQLSDLVERQNNTAQELETAKRKIFELIHENQKEIVSEGFGGDNVSALATIESPRESFVQALDRAKRILDEEGEGIDHVEMLAMIDSLCRAGLRAMEETRKENQDLQLQVESADKKLRETVQFLELQASEREAERDETQRDLEALRQQLAQKERECVATQEIAQESVNREIIKNVEQLEQRMREMTILMEESDIKKQETEKELKEAVDKIWVLRDIIRDLESQLDVRTQSELKLQKEIEDLQNLVKQQHRSNEELAHELESLKSLPDSQQLIEHADHLEKELAEFRKFGTVESLEQIKAQLEEIESIMLKKTKDLEFLHAFVSSTSCSSPSEDMSASDIIQKNSKKFSTDLQPLEMVQHLNNTIQKHTRVEHAAIKRIKDLEMQMNSINQKYQDLQVERDVLQERLSEQLTEISTLQMRLDEQRHLVQTITKQSNLSLENEIFELKNQNRDLTDRLNSQDKQLKQLNNILDKTTQQLKNAQDDVMALNNKHKETVKQLKNEIKRLMDENKNLQAKINKDTENIKLPELVDTLLSDKNSEIDMLKDELKEKNQIIEQLSKTLKEQSDGKNSARTLSDVVSISEFDEPDIMRKNGSLQQSIHSIDNICKASLEESLPKESVHPEISAIECNEIELEYHEPNVSSIPPNLKRTDPDNDHSERSLKSSSEKRVHFDDGNIVNVLNEEITRLKSELANALSDNQNKQSSEIRLLDKMKSLESSLNLKQKELDEYKQILKDLETKYESKVEELDKCKSEYEEQKEKFNIIEEQYSKTAKDLENKLVQCDSLTVDCKELENKIKEQNELIDNLKQKITEYENSLRENNEKLKNLEGKIIDRDCEIEILNEDVNKYQEEITSLQQQLRDSQLAQENFVQDNKLSRELKEKDLLLLQKESEINELQKEINHLQDYLKEKDKIIHQITEDSNSLKRSLEMIQNKMKETGNIIDLMQKLKDEQRLTAQLREEIAALKMDISRLEEGSPKLKEIVELEKVTGQVQQELEYSAQLDSSILNAIEETSNKDASEQISKKERLQKVDNFYIEVPSSNPNPNNDVITELQEKIEMLNNEKDNLSENLKRINSSNQELQTLKNSLVEELNEIRRQLSIEKDNCLKLQSLLDEEKQNSNDVQLQDANIIEQMRIRLETALENEIELEKTIENEKKMRSELMERLKDLQIQLETALNPNVNSQDIIELKKQINDLNELLEQKDNEIATWKAKYNALNEDFEKVKNNNHQTVEIENMHKMDQIIAENVKLKIEKSDLKNKLSELVDQLGKSKEVVKIRQHEWEEIQKENEALTEAKMASLKREKEEMRECRQRLEELQKEKRLLVLQINDLKKDLQMSRDQEARLTELLARERDEKLDSSVPVKFLEKLNGLQVMLDNHVKQNKQMTDTLQKLTEERQFLQQRVKQLESQTAKKNIDTENDAKFNTLFGKFLRVESYRKALAWQKQYLLAIVYSYEEGNIDRLIPPTISSAKVPKNKKKHRSFKVIAVAALAVFRMKFMVRRWSTGVRLNGRIWSRHRHKIPTFFENLAHIEYDQKFSENVTHLGQGDAAANMQRHLRTPDRPIVIPPWTGETPPSREFIFRHTDNFPTDEPVPATQYVDRFNQIR